MFATTSMAKGTTRPPPNATPPAKSFNLSFVSTEPTVLPELPPALARGTQIPLNKSPVTAITSITQTALCVKYVVALALSASLTLLESHSCAKTGGGVLNRHPSHSPAAHSR